MQLENHTIYFDITQCCNIGCDFCMYANRHSGNNLILNSQARKNIARIFQSNGIKKVSISGEGEPLNNIKTFKEILSLSPGGIHFEFITSGAIPHHRLLELYDDLADIMSGNNDQCNIRLSSDSFHLSNIPHKPHGVSLRYFLERRPSNLSLSFRSIDIDKIFTRNFLCNELLRLGFDAKICEINVLDDKLIVDNDHFLIAYKNLVHPCVAPGTKYMTLEEYLEALERKYQRPFTFGSLNPWPNANGMDITIKPDGTIIFYGIDLLPLANLFTDRVDLNFFQQIVEHNKLVHKLYTVPLREIIMRLAKEKKNAEIIQRANNPYWILPGLSSYNEKLLWEAL